MKLRDWLSRNKNSFSEGDIRFILARICQTDLPRALLDERRFLNGEEEKELDRICREYSRGVPLAYLLNSEEFFGLTFLVNKNVLVPRPETELLVEKALGLAAGNRFSSMLDLCCGCANIAVSFKKFSPRACSVWASDISLPALEVARQNCLSHGLEIRLVESDLLAAFKPSSFDLIVSNPPYVETKAICGLLDYEPRQALDGADDGLAVIKKIIEQAPCYLKAGGYIIIEIGASQKKAVKELIDGCGAYENREWIKDYAGLWRGVVLKKAVN